MVLLTPLFIALGFWQLDRAEQKRHLATALETRRKLPALPLGTAALPDAGELEFRKLVATGRFLTDKTVLIENRKHQGKTGFHIITPLRLQNGRILLVNRGWTPRPAAGESPRIPATPEVLTIEGEGSIPQPPALDLTPSSETAQRLPHWPFLTLQHYAAWSGLEILPIMLLQSGPRNDGLIREWPQPEPKVGMHIGYAIQWFAFALITLGIWLRLSLRGSGEAVQ